MDERELSVSAPESGEFCMSRFLAGFALGVAAGAGLAIAYAPEAGEDARGRISDAASALRDRAGESYSDVADRAHAVLGDTRSALTEWLDRSKESAEQLAARLNEALAAGCDAYTERKQELESRSDSPLDA